MRLAQTLRFQTHTFLLEAFVSSVSVRTFSVRPLQTGHLPANANIDPATAKAATSATTANTGFAIVAIMRAQRLPNGKVSDGSQPPMTFDLSLSESAGSRSLHRRVRLFRLDGS